MRPVAIVQHEPLCPPGSVRDVVHELGIDQVAIEAWRTERWPAPDEIGALIVMGGTMSVDEVDEFPFLASSTRLMSDALEAAVPTLGICLGAQMMARVLGSGVYRSESRNAGFSPLELNPEGRSDPLVAPFASGVSVLQFHEDTFDEPPGSVLLGFSASSGLIQAFRYGETAYGLQFHAEVDADILRRWCRQIGSRAMLVDWGISEDQLMQEAERSLDAQHAAGREFFTGFLEAAASA